ncbi:hypothetical protein JCM10049v2_001993 [Rhodotorula toruloides]
MAGQQNGLRNGQLAQPSLAARMNSGAFLGSYSLGGTPIKAEQKPTVQATPPQPSQGPSLLQRTNSSGGGGEGGSLLARMGGEQAAESRAGSSTSTGQGGSGRGINLRERLSRPQQPVATASPIPTRPQSSPPKDGPQANNASIPPPPRPTSPAKRHVRQADGFQTASNATSSVALADRIHGSSTSPSTHRLVERPEPPVWQQPAATHPPQGHSLAPVNPPPQRLSSPPRDPRKSPPKGANKQLRPPALSLTEANPASAQAPKIPSIQRLPPGHVAAQTASAHSKQTTPASRSSEAGTPPLPDPSPAVHLHSAVIPAPTTAASSGAPSPVAIRPAPSSTSQPPAITSVRTATSLTTSTPSRQPIPLRPPSSAESGTPPPRPPRSNRDAESGTPPRPPPPTTRPPASATPATPAPRSSHKSPSIPSSAAPRTPKSEPTSPDFRTRPLPPPRPAPYVPPAPTKPSLAELQRQADEARELAQQAEREARRRRDQEAEERRKAQADAEEMEKKRREEEVERVRAEAAEKERARLDAEAKEHARLEAEEKERVRLEAEAKERARLQEEERIKREAEETARKEREAKAEAERVEKERLASERKEKERQAREETRKREEAEKKARLDAELEAQEKARQEAKRKEVEREKKERLEEERRTKEAEAKAKLDAELEAQEKERQEEMRKEEERKVELRKEQERKAELRKEQERTAKIAELAARQAERDRRALAAREEEAKKAERERQELARLATLARKKKEEEERRRKAADDEARKKAEEESKRKAEDEEQKRRAAKEEEEREAEEAMWRKEIPPLWATTTYAWTVRPGCPAMSAIVHDRDQVFASSAKLGHRPSRKIIAKHMETYTHGTGGRAAYASRVRDYESFCRSVDVPPWPLSTVMIALFCIATAPDGFALSTASNIVIALRNSTRNCVDDWQALPGYSELASWPRADQALTEWKNLLNPIPDEEDSPLETPQGMSPAASEPAYNVEEDHQEEEEEDLADQDDEDGADLDEDEMSDAEAKGKPGRSGKRRRTARRLFDAVEMKKFVLECTKKYPLPDMPDMPRPGQLFANLQALLKATAASLVPKMGVTPVLAVRSIACSRRKYGCPFRLSTVTRNDGKLVVKANATIAHNHGPDSRLLADPNWRPAMRNDAVAAAVAKHDKLMATKKGKKRLSDSSELPAAKHPRRESGTVKSDAAKREIATKNAPVEQDEPAGPEPSTLAKDASPLPAPSDAPRNAEEAKQPQSGDHDLDIERSRVGETGSSAIKASSPSTEPKPTDMTVVKAASSTPAPQLPSQPSLPLTNSPAAGSSYRPPLEAFLVALHPSLAPLTDPLLAAGITSNRSLALFAGMEPSSRHALYEDLRIEGDMPMLDAAAVEALDEACGRAQASHWSV